MIEQLQSMTAQLSTMLGRGDIVRVHTEPMASDEQGFSGAAMLRLRADYKDGTQESFICKRDSGKDDVNRTQDAERPRLERGLAVPPQESARRGEALSSYPAVCSRGRQSNFLYWGIPFFREEIVSLQFLFVSYSGASKIKENGRSRRTCGFCSFAKGEIATARDARRRRYSPVPDCQKP